MSKDYVAREGCDVTAWPVVSADTTEEVAEVYADYRICAINGCFADVFGINDPNNAVFGINAVTQGGEEVVDGEDEEVETDLDDQDDSNLDG